MRDLAAMIWASIEQAISQSTGHLFSIQSKTSLSGGSINRAYRIDGAGRNYFVKLNSADRLEMFEAEADALRELADAKAIRIPTPICSGLDDDQSWLVTDYIAFGQ
ncbi:MAG: fructosamine kinase family protein [Mariprofundus sp.]